MPKSSSFTINPFRSSWTTKATGGKRLGVLHTPDFFVIRTTAAGWEEWKTEEELLRLAERSPNRYLRRRRRSVALPAGRSVRQRFWFLLPRPFFP